MKLNIHLCIYMYISKFYWNQIDWMSLFQEYLYLDAFWPMHYLDIEDVTKMDGKVWR